MKLNLSHAASAWLVVGGLAIVKLTAHLVTAGNYGLFVDELYFLAAGQHLAWGYVDMPPMIALLAWLAKGISGTSVTGIHIFPAVFSAGLVILTGLLVHELGGRLTAQLLAGLSVIISGVNLVAGSYLSMNVIEPLIWMGCVYVLIRLIKTGNTRLWLAFGVLAGMGLMNKHTMLMFGFALIAGLLLTPERRLMKNRWFLFGGLIALLIFLPNLIWNIQHDFPILELQANIRRSQRNIALNPLQFLMEEVIYLHPLTLPIWLAGLGWFFFHPSGRPYRVFGWAWLLTLGILLASQGRTYYLAPAIPILLAGGAVWLESLFSRPGLRWLRFAYPILLLAGGVITAPLFLPVLPPESYVRYTESLGIRPPRLENFQESALPQLFADRFGWPEMAESAAQVFNQLTPQEQEQVAIFGGSYGSAGAIDFYGPELGLPSASSGHQNYYFWPPVQPRGNIMIALGVRPELLSKYYQKVEVVGKVFHPYSMRYQNFPIYLARDPRKPVDEFWSELKNWN